MTVTKAMTDLHPDIAIPGIVTDEAALRAHYGEPHKDIWLKQIDHIDAGARALIAASPFMVMATSSPAGLDCSPKGDEPGFVQVLDEKTLLIPDRPGNRRVDGLRNILKDPRVGLIFFIPGVGETFRVNGHAAVSLDDGLRERCAKGGKPATAVIVLRVEEAFIHCSRAVAVAGLWAENTKAPSGLPTAREVFEGHLALSRSKEDAPAKG